MGRLILMTQREFEEPLSDALRRAAPGVSLSFAWSLKDLEAELAHDPDASRVLSIGSDVIVPGTTLRRLASPAYNLHPGPPNYPGIFPSVFALYEGAQEFGVTLHEMAPVVDSGAICLVERFKIDPRWDRLSLDTHTFVVLMHVVERTAPLLADVRAPLPHSGDAWSGQRRTRKDFDALCRLPENFTAIELAQRLRAVGEGPEHCLTTTRNGQAFRLETGRRGAVVRAGHTIAAE